MESYSPAPGWPGSATRGAITQVFEVDEMLPTLGQGALAVECRDGDAELAALLAAVNDEASMAAAVAERSLLEALAVGCSAPVCGYAAGPDQLLMRVAVFSIDGTWAVRAYGSAPAADARRLVRDLAAELLHRGAAGVIGNLVDSKPGRCGPEVRTHEGKPSLMQH
jgi:hydroxymethylbilane synthase